jgi:predicted Zn finger-like uncharacterized protein
LEHDRAGKPVASVPDPMRHELAMLIVCPTCATAYQIQLAALGAAGRSVRCAQCKNVWLATPESAVMEQVAAAPVIIPPPRPAAPPPAPPAMDDFGAAAPSDFSVETVMPDPTAVEEAERVLAASDAPPLAPAGTDETVDASGAAKFDPDAEDIETIAARRARQTAADRKGKPTLLRRILSLPVLILVLAAALIALVQARATVVRHFPQTASLFSMIGMPVNLRGLFFQDVKTRSEIHDGVMVLVVEGVIVNLTRNTLDVPRLRFSLRNGSSHEVYAWTALPSRPTLGSGDGLQFRTRLASPPADGRDVIVRFFNRRDAALGTP